MAERENRPASAASGVTQPRLGVVGWLRWGWRQSRLPGSSPVSS